MSTAAVVAGTAAAGLAQGVIGSNAAGNAAAAQTAAANKAAANQGAASQQALGYQNQQFNQGQAAQQPYAEAGAGGLNALQYGLGTGGTANGSPVAQGSLLTPYGQSFSAPTGLTEQNDPGYQARLQLGTDALQKSAAARGSVLTGGTAKALDTYGQDYASNEYGNVYNRALNTFNTNYNAYNTNQSNQYNKLAALAGAGQQQVQAQANQGQAASNNVTSNLLGTATQQGQDYTNAGAATASGYVGSANAINGAIGGVTNGLTNYAALQSLGGGNSGSSYGTVRNGVMNNYGGY